MDQLTRAFLSLIDPVCRPMYVDDDLGAKLKEYVARGQAPWSTFVVSPQRFLQFIAQRVSAESQGRLPEPAEELYVACACTDGNPRAIAAFNETYLSEVGRVIASMSLPSDAVAEIKSCLQERLFAAPEGERPAIERYAGKGPLKTLIRVAALRAALNQLQRNPTEEALTEEELLEIPDSSDPELAYWRNRHQQEFKQAFELSVSRVCRADRTLLRLHIKDGLSIDQIGALYGVHRATAARWLAEARERIARHTRQELAARLQLTSSQLHGLMKYIRSELNLSISRLLNSEAPAQQT